MKINLFLILLVFFIGTKEAVARSPVIYSCKVGFNSPYCFKLKRQNYIYTWPFNLVISMGLEASFKNFTFDFTLDRSGFKRITHKSVNDTLVSRQDLNFALTQFKFLPKYRILNSGNSALFLGCGLAMAVPSATKEKGRSYILALGNGVCLNIEYTYKMPKRECYLYSGISYEKLNNKPIIGYSIIKNKYGYLQYQYAPIYILNFGIKCGIGRNKG